MNREQARKNWKLAKSRGFLKYEGMPCKCGGTVYFVSSKSCCDCASARAKEDKAIEKAKLKRDKEQKKEVYYINMKGGFQV